MRIKQSFRNWWNRIFEAAIQSLHQQIATNHEEVMATLQQTLDAVAAQKTDEASLIALAMGIKQQLTDALAAVAAAGTAIPDAVQAQIDQVFSAVTLNDQAVKDAVNTVGGPAPTVAAPAAPSA